jgi:hypothetical protein
MRLQTLSDPKQQALAALLLQCLLACPQFHAFQASKKQFPWLFSFVQNKGVLDDMETRISVHPRFEVAFGAVTNR